MKRTRFLVGGVLLLSGCAVNINTDAGPTQTANDEIDAGKAETVRAEIRMGGGELHLKGSGRTGSERRGQL